MRRSGAAICIAGIAFRKAGGAKLPENIKQRSAPAEAASHRRVARTLRPRRGKLGRSFVAAVGKSGPMSSQAPAYATESAGRAHTRPGSHDDRRPVVLHWVFGHLRKRGSFEDYLVAAAEELARAGLRLHVVARLLIDPAVRSALEERGAGVTCAPDEDLNNSGFFARTVWRLRPRLVHCHFGSPSTSLALLAKALGVRRFVFTDHGSRTSLESGAATASLRGLRRMFLASFVDLYLPVSDFVGEQIRREVGAPRRKVKRLFNGVDLGRFRPVAGPDERSRLRASLGVEPDRRCVFYVGQFTDLKGVDDILAIQDEVLRRKDDVAFIWIGDGPLAPEVERRTSARVRYLGLRNDVEALLPAADLILAPSRWHEAFCLTVAEAAASGVPAVAARVGGVPEVVLDGKTGLLIEPGDRAALLESCVRLLTDEPLRAAMAAAARRRAETSFSLATMVRDTLRHYQALGLRTRDVESTSFPRAGS